VPDPQYKQHSNSSDHSTARVDSGSAIFSTQLCN